MAGLTINAMKGSVAVPFLQRFPIYNFLLLKHIRECCLFCSSLSPFIRCEEEYSEGGGESVSALGNNGRLSLQRVN